MSYINWSQWVNSWWTLRSFRDIFAPNVIEANQKVAGRQVNRFFSSEFWVKPQILTLSFLCNHPPLTELLLNDFTNSSTVEMNEDESVEREYKYERWPYISWQPHKEETLNLKKNMTGIKALTLSCIQFKIQVTVRKCSHYMTTFSGWMWHLGQFSELNN